MIASSWSWRRQPAVVATSLQASGVIGGVGLVFLIGMFAAFSAGQQSLGMRLGWVNDVTGIVTLPLAVPAMLVLHDRLRPSAGRAGDALLVLAIGATHRDRGAPGAPGDPSADIRAADRPGVGRVPRARRMVHRDGPARGAGGHAAARHQARRARRARTWATRCGRSAWRARSAPEDGVTPVRAARGVPARNRSAAPGVPLPVHRFRTGVSRECEPEPLSPRCWASPSSSPRAAAAAARRPPRPQPRRARPSPVRVRGGIAVRVRGGIAVRVGGGGRRRHGQPRHHIARLGAHRRRRQDAVRLHPGCGQRGQVRLQRRLRGVLAAAHGRQRAHPRNGPRCRGLHDDHPRRRLTQIAFYGQPLYYFAADAAAGDVKGQGLNDKWYVVDAEGKTIK